jgi:hypothetical protein
VYQYSGYSSSQAYRLNLAYNGNQAGDLFGALTQNNVLLNGTPVGLEQFNGYRFNALATWTDYAGIYHFRGRSSLPVGHYYYAYFDSPADDTALAYWWCNSLYSYTAGQNTPACSFDVANVFAVEPASDTSLSLPITFQWTRRAVTADNYRVRLRSANWSSYWESPDLGYANSYVLTSLPSGFTTNTPYRWDVIIVNSNGTGIPYYYRNIVFLSSATRAVATPATGQPMDWSAACRAGGAEADLSGKSQRATAAPPQNCATCALCREHGQLDVRH